MPYPSPETEKDWETIKDYFNIPTNMKDIDFTKVTLKSEIK